MPGTGWPAIWTNWWRWCLIPAREAEARGLRTLMAITLSESDPVLQVHAQYVRALATRILDAMAHAKTIEAEVRRLTDGWTQPLQAIVGISTLTAGAIAVELGGGVFRSDAALAMDAGVAPPEASSGTHCRHRLNRHENRRLNCRIHRIALTQQRCSPDAQAYLARKRQEGKGAKEAVRCLKRLIVRAIFTAWK